MEGYRLNDMDANGSAAFVMFGVVKNVQKEYARFLTIANDGVQQEYTLMPKYGGLKNFPVGSLVVGTPGALPHKR